MPVIVGYKMFKRDHLRNPDTNGVTILKIYLK
jgi:hypothetical protein